MGILERRKAIEDEIARTQKNKKTEYHIGRLKGQLARLKTEMLENAARAAGARAGDGFEVAKRRCPLCTWISFSRKIVLQQNNHHGRWQTESRL